MTQFIYHGAGNSEAQQKIALAFMLAQDSTGIATDGVLAGLGVAQTTTASASVVVGKGAGAAQDTLLGGAGMPVLDTDLTLDVLGANPMGGVPRNDLVVFDTATISSGSGGVRVIVGTPNAVPTDPAVPATAVALARLRHAASATTVPSSVIDDLRVYTGLAKSQAATPFADYSRGAGGTITRATWTKLAYTIQNHLEGGITYSGGDFTVPSAGLYECQGQVMFTGSAGLVTVGSLIAVDGATQETSYAQGMASGNWSARATRTLRLTAGQKVSFSAYHDATANIATQADSSSTWCSVRRVGD